MKKILLALSFFVALCSCSNKEYNNNNNVNISIVCDEHVTTDSETFQIVKKGESAIFLLIFEDEYEFYSSSAGTFNEDTSELVIDSTFGNVTAYVTCTLIGSILLTINNDDSLGTVNVEPNKKSYAYGEVVTIKTISLNRSFLCYTFDLPFRNGLKKKSGVPVSYDNEFSFNVYSDCQLYVNYFAEDSKVIEYDLNGGVTTGGSSIIKTDYKEYNEGFNFCASTINLSNYAFNKGYILESLNTSKDGLGTRIGIGSRIKDELYYENRIKLYAQWKEYTDISNFTYVESSESEELVITSCSYADEEIVIPGFIDGKKVTTIAQGAFNSLEAKSIVFPDTITTIESGAFIQMNSVIKITFYSSISFVDASSFDMPNLKTLFLNKNTNVLDHNYEEDNISRYKEAILRLDSNKPRVLFVGHSTIRINHYLYPLDEKWGDEYSFFIYAASAGIHGYLLLMSLADIILPTDHLIIPVWPILNYCTSRNLAFLQYDFDSLVRADYQIIKDFIWTSFVAYRQTCTELIGVTALLPEATNYSRWDKYGMNLENNPTTNVDNKSIYDYTNYLYGYDGSTFDYLNNFVDYTGIDSKNVLLTWNAYNQNNIKNTDYYELFDYTIRNRFSNYTFFDTQLENIYPGNYFNVNDFMHLSTTGTAVRVNRWLDQLPL